MLLSSTNAIGCHLIFYFDHSLGIVNESTSGNKKQQHQSTSTFSSQSIDLSSFASIEGSYCDFSHSVLVFLTLFVFFSPRFWSKCLSYVFVPRPARVLRPPSITSVCFMFSLLNSCLSLCCFVATLMTFALWLL